MSPGPAAVSQGAFAAALLDAALPVPAGLVVWNGSDPTVRLAIHRNNVIISLVDALGETFAVVRQLVGAEFFAAMARCYVADQPPRSPVLAEYGESFAVWLAGFEPVRTVPYLTDMARLEFARVRAFHAPDAPALGAAEMQTLLDDPQALPRLRLALHPSLTLLRARYAVLSLWLAHQGEGAIEAVVLERAEAVLIVRHEDDVLVVALSESSADFIAALAAGRTLGQAAAAGAADTAFDLSTTLALLIAQGALTACD